ncbi:MAG TPA: hypothetical protein VLA15_10795 [Desulfurivibrionaceae bacterium]|nr:hypothetical protein [Desulfurivibrionaceae bacterium]
MSTDAMTFTCPHCQKQHSFPDGVALPPNSAAHCKRCGRRFLLNGAEPERQLQEPASEKNAVEETSPSVDQGDGSGTDPEIILAFPELQELPPGKFLLDEIFAPGKGHRKLDRRLAKLILATAPLLSEVVLDKDELVCRLASGIAYFPFEIPYANGLLTWPLNYYALVATNHRLIFINLDQRLSHPSRYVFQVPYGNISRVSRGFYGSSLIIHTLAGRTWDFTTVDRRLATGMEKFIREQLERLESEGEDFSPSSQLCPGCYHPVPENLASCPSCQIPYKSSRVAIKKSLLLPGTGNLYLAYPLLGIAEILGYLCTWILTISLVIIGIPGGILAGSLLVLAYPFMTAFMAGRMAGKGYLPDQHEADEIPTEPEGAVE